MTDGPGASTGRHQPRIVFVAVLIVVVAAAAAATMALRGFVSDGPESNRFAAADATRPVVPTDATPASTAATGPTGSPSPSRSPSKSPRASTSPSPAAPPASSTSGTTSGVYEAEAAGNGRSSQMAIRSVAGASGGRVVTGVGNGRMLSFTGIDVARTGDYAVTVAYLSADARRCSVGLGRDWDQFTFPASGGSERVATMTLTLQLHAGRNTVEIGNTPGRWCPDLDRITVAPR